jgi:predicted GNAT superfamily acetyltransferase
VEIPSDINHIKEKDMDAAQEWRDVARQIFETYFSAGYSVYNVTSETRNKERRTYYLLRKDIHEDNNP